MLLSKIHVASNGEPIRLSAHQRIQHAEVLERLRAMAETLEDAKSRRTREDLPKAAGE
jgi:hypothetical protein